MTPDRLAELEEERRFLLRSLRDLDAERSAGDIDDADHAELRDGYTKRAADVLRQIDAGRDALPARRPSSWPRRLAVVAAVIVVAAVAGVLVARTSGQRTPADAATRAERDVAVLLSEARQLLAVDLGQAQQRYQQVLDQRPDDPEALTYNAWLLFIGSRGADATLAETATGTARQQLQRVIELDPTYPDPHCFLAVIAANVDDDAATAEEEVDACLALDPPSLVRQLVESLLDVTPTTAE